MKAVVSIFTLTLALGFAQPLFAAEVATANTKAKCDKASGFWNDRTKECQQRGPFDGD